MDIAAGYAALTAAFTLAKGLKDVNDQVKINEIVIELQGRIMEAQEAVRDGREKMSALEDELRRLSDWSNEAQRYKLVEFGNGRFCYEIKEEEMRDEPFHLLCPACFTNRKKSILQYAFTSTLGEHHKCPNCGTDFQFGGKGAPLRRSSTMLRN